MEGTQPRIGILGEGQLALMLADAGSQLGYEVHCFCTHSPAPAQLSRAQCHLGSYDSPEDLQNFLKSVDILTLESEFAPTTMVERALLDFPKVLTCPFFANIELIKNKLNQKYLFKKLSLPTSEFKAFSLEFDNLSTWLPQTFKNMGALVIKAAEGGYDGKGNLVVRDESQLQLAFEFCEGILDNGFTFYTEKLIPFQNEVAMVYARSSKGEFIHYPLVITHQEQNICNSVYGPATAFATAEALEQQARTIGQTLADHLNYIGVFALEFFVCNGELLINEMAPRVHNSGHYTQIAPESSQFSNHIRAITGVELVQPQYDGCFYMKNLLAPKEHHLDLPHSKHWNAFSTQTAQVHWYGKVQSKKLRKMGHINTAFENSSHLKQVVADIQSLEEQLWSQIYE